MTATTKTKTTIQKTPGVCGGDACIGTTRIAVWMIIEMKQKGFTDEQILASFPDLLTRDILADAFDYSNQHPDEIREAIRLNNLDD